MDGPPLFLDAMVFGWVQQRRLYWLHGPSGGISATGTYTLPPDFTMDPSTPTNPTRRISRTSGKPWPATGLFSEGVGPIFDPTRVCAGAETGFGTFMREFPHPTDRVAGATAAAQQRFYEDRRLSPPHAYKAVSLLWKGRRLRAAQQPQPAHHHADRTSRTQGRQARADAVRVSKVPGKGCPATRRQGAGLGPYGGAAAYRQTGIPGRLQGVSRTARASVFGCPP